MSTDLRGASAASLESLTEALEASLAGGAETDRVAEDLFTVAGVLESEHRLRRVLTDSSIDAKARSGLVAQVFSGRLAEGSTALLTRAVELRWVSTHDLGAALQHLGVQAVVKTAEEAGTGDGLQDELFAVAQLVRERPELRDALADPARSEGDKQQLVRGLLGGQVSDPGLRLVAQALAGPHHNVLSTLEDYQLMVAEHRNRATATVRVAHPLEDDERERLEQALAARYDKPVHTNVVVDPTLLGGVRVEIGDDVIDGTIVSRLDDARRRLAG